MPEVRHKLLPKQAALIRATERHTVYSGAVGAGKSRALCVDAIMHVAEQPKARYGLFRKTLTALKKSTLKTLLEGDGNAPPVLPPGTYSHNKNDAEIKVRGGGSILYSGVETPEAVRSMNLSRAGVDEVTELQADDYNAIDDRVRLDIGEPLCIKSATNPGTPSHWMAKMMGLSPGASGPAPDCRLILTRTPDNTYLPASYLQSFERHRGTVYYRRMFLGEWCGAEGMVYDRWVRDTHVRTKAAPPKARILGVDYGYTDPYCVLDIHIDGDGRYHVAREVYETKLVPEEMVAHVKAWANDETDVIVDSAQPEHIETLRRAGVRAMPADKGPGSVVYGINLVQNLLVPDEMGARLTVDPCCTNTVREFETYEWAQGVDGLKDKPRDADNHAMDALRYVVMHREAHRTPPVVVATSGGGYDAEEMWSSW